ncbi:MAG: SDR family oxidoreductase [Chromatiales bacterium]|nr:SDR family oxidoreductase [Chromatiales bacterium]
MSAETASVNRGDYCMSKAALSMAAKLWAARLAPGRHPGLRGAARASCSPDMTSGVKAKYDALIAQGIVPQGRWGTPEDVGKAVRALLEGAFPFSAGGVFDVDGGFHISRL